MVGYVSQSSQTLEQALGTDLATRFEGLSGLHGDGWGVASWADGHVHTHSSPAPAGLDPAFGPALRSASSRAAFVHLRWASDGMAVRPQNAHPFRFRSLALCHNGGILPVERLDALLSPGARAALRGTTDSERYLHHIVD
ncbi:MAG: class II glutamine amidotransferase, partial [Propionibacteriaceae bacterium]|nr:class II glutamine amidotransferase [Propionibacteriaceae bacterium]